MPFTLARVVPWGRSFDEYCRMFALGEEELRCSILGCADGPASFNAGLTTQGGQVISCDPLYRYSAAEIETRIAQCFDTVLEQARKNVSAFKWPEEIPDVETLGRVRRSAMHEFLVDYPSGKQAGRYVVGELPALPFCDRQFDLALCSHFLFLYDSLEVEFYLQSILELLRVAKEIRIFPLVQLDGNRSPFVHEILAKVTRPCYSSKVMQVPYEFQRGANEMLRMCRND